jgi:hypothetical protein
MVKTTTTKEEEIGSIVVTKTCDVVPSTWETKLYQLLSTDSRIGWPSYDCTQPVNKHGWFRPGNRELLGKLMNSNKNIKCVIELGSWLGLSTNFILDSCPNDAVVFAVDLWSNEYFYSDNHYNKNDKKFAEILSKTSIYHQFLVNTQHHKLISNDETKQVSKGLVPMKMDTLTAMQILADAGVQPDLIYIDASHHYDYVVDDVRACLRLFPDAWLVGDDWDNEDVKRAVQFVSKEACTSIHVQGRTCWTFEKHRIEDILRRDAADEEEKEQKRKALKRARDSGFDALLKKYQKK